MNFQNVNLLNVRMNSFSGNLLPLTPDDPKFPITWKMYSGFTLLVQMVQAIVLIPGIVLVPWEKALIDGAVSFVVTMEVFFMIIRFHIRKRLVCQLIQKLNDILRIEDEAMRNIVTTTLKPMETPLRFYSIAGGLSVTIWYCMPLILIFKKTSFFYEDYRTPAALSKQPFSIDVFLLGSAIIFIGSVYMFLRKVGIDIYMIHLILLITAQYRYITMRLAVIFRDENRRNETDGFQKKYCSEKNRWADKEIKALCQHHKAVIHLSSMLKELLSFNCSVIYVNSVLRFCFISIMLSTVSPTNFLESFCIVMFACGVIVQFYMLCSCVQQLLDASKDITNKAFHEKWYQFGPSVKHTFLLMIISNNLECKLSACDKFNLSLPSFMAILNQSYSIALLLLKVK